MSTRVTVRHNFETAHRLFEQGPNTKCWNLHGHSWWVEVDVEAPAVDERGMVVEFGAFKKALRDYIDGLLDHGTMLNAADPFVDVLQDAGCKVFLFPADPTVEAVAAHVAGIAEGLLHSVDRADGAAVVAVRLSETHVNGASWIA